MTGVVCTASTFVIVGKPDEGMSRVRRPRSLYHPFCYPSQSQYILTYTNHIYPEGKSSDDSLSPILTWYGGYCDFEYCGASVGYRATVCGYTVVCLCTMPQAYRQTFVYPGVCTHRYKWVHPDG